MNKAVLASADLTPPSLLQLTELLLSQRTPEGIWEGRLSTSALSTATACMALSLAAKATQDLAEAERFQGLADRGLQWLEQHQNSDGGWGDTTLSISNISTTMLAYAVLNLNQPSGSSCIQRARDYVHREGGVAAVIRRYGSDHTFSVPILTHCALAGIVSWRDVIPLPFELACVPAKWYAAVRMPVVSYALPALIAIGQVIFHHQGHWNPILRVLRRRAIQPSLRVLEAIQPTNGGFLEATPLTSFVCMSLLGCHRFDHPVTRKCLNFIEKSVRPDGSWPIDTNLTTWVTTLSVNALCGNQPGDSGEGAGCSGPGTTLESIDRTQIREWLLAQQYRETHPYTNAAPGGWSWTNLPGGVPDADDTPGAMLALLNLRAPQELLSDREISALMLATEWLLNLQNRDGGWPTFCRGWGKLPFDRSSNDLTAHAIRALRAVAIRLSRLPLDTRDRITAATDRGIAFLKKTQRSDGTWLPLWFGNQFSRDDENPLYGTARVLMCLEESSNAPQTEEMARKAVNWVVGQQNDDGGWSARNGLKSSVEETGLAVEALSSSTFFGWSGVRESLELGAGWLRRRVEEGTVSEPSPIGFYFAKLWYFEALYPMIFATAGLTRWQQLKNDLSESTSQE